MLLLHDDAVTLVDGGVAQSGSILAGFMDFSAGKDQNTNIKIICASIEGCDDSESTSSQIQYLSSDSVDYNVIGKYLPTLYHRLLDHRNLSLKVMSGEFPTININFQWMQT